MKYHIMLKIKHFSHIIFKLEHILNLENKTVKIKHFPTFTTLHRQLNTGHF